MHLSPAVIFNNARVLVDIYIKRVRVHQIRQQRDSAEDCREREERESVDRQNTTSQAVQRIYRYKVYTSFLYSVFFFVFYREQLRT